MLRGTRGRSFKEIQEFLNKFFDVHDLQPILQSYEIPPSRILPRLEFNFV